MDDIAHEVGMAKPSLYYYVSTKEELFKRIVAREKDRFLGAARAVIESNNGAQARLRAYLERRLEFMKELANLSNMNLELIHKLGPQFEEEYRLFETEERSVVAAIVSLGIAEGAFTRVSPEDTARAIVDMVRGLRRFHHRDGLSAGDQSETEYANFARDMDIIGNLVVRGLCATPGEANEEGEK